MTEETNKDAAEQTIELARGAMENYLDFFQKSDVRFTLGTNRSEQENSKLCRQKSSRQLSSMHRS